MDVKGTGEVLPCTEPAREPPRVSLVTTVYNGERYLARFLLSVERTLATVSVLERTRFEILVVDDASTDRTAAIIADFRERLPLTLVTNEQNIGAGQSRNRALEIATGDWIAFADSDDELTEAWAGRLVTAMDGPAKNTEIITYDAIATWEPPVVRPDYRIGWTKPAGVHPGREFAVDVLQASSVGARMWNKVYRRHLFDGVRFIWREFEDYFVLANVLPLVKSVYALPEILYVYRRRPDSLSQYTNPNGGVSALCACIDAMRNTTEDDLCKAMRRGLMVMIADFLFHVPGGVCDKSRLRRFAMRELVHFLLSGELFRVKLKAVLGVIRR